MKVWNKLSDNAKFYIISFTDLAICWGILALIGVSFLNLIFFLTAFVWHFALTTPGLKEKVMTNHHRLSFLAVVVRMNHYLQIFINLKRLPYAASFIRALSPALFTFILFVLGGNGNILFTVLGSFCFEVVYIWVKNRTTLLGHRGDQEIPPAIPSAERSRE